MKTIKTATILLPVDRAPITLTYRLGEDPSGYAISAENLTTGERITIRDITPSRDRALALFGLLVRGQVTTITFPEVVEDFLAS